MKTLVVLFCRCSGTDEALPLLPKRMREREGGKRRNRGEGSAGQGRTGRRDGKPRQRWGMERVRKGRENKGGNKVSGTLRMSLLIFHST